MVKQKETKEKIKTNGIPSLFEYADSNALLKITLGVISTAFLAWIGNNILK